MILNSIVTLDNDKEYVVVNSIKYAGKEYLVLSEATEEKANIMFCEYINDELILVLDETLVNILIKLQVSI